MIGYLRGKIIDTQGNDLWLDVNGVGYRVRRSQKLEARSLKLEEIELYIHTAVREDAITLYGFVNREELALFEMLIEVNGVGPRTAMEIVGAAKSEEIEEAIARADVNFFSRIKGIGKKSAQRIIIDLKNKIGSLKEVDLAAEDEDSVVFMALTQFGFKAADIQAVMKNMDQGLSEQEQVKLGLSLLGKTRR